jgi:hypothetical protein
MGLSAHQTSQQLSRKALRDALLDTVESTYPDKGASGPVVPPPPPPEAPDPPATDVLPRLGTELSPTPAVPPSPGDFPRCGGRTRITARPGSPRLPPVAPWPIR